MKPRASAAGGDLSETTLDQIAQRLYREVERIDRKFRNKWYEKCFVGREAVQFIVDNIAAAAGSRREATRIGQLLLDRKYFHHVARQHAFADVDNVFFRFVVDEKSYREEDVVSLSTARRDSDPAIQRSNSIRTYASGVEGSTRSITAGHSVPGDFEIPFEVVAVDGTRSRAPVLFNPETDECSIWLPFQDLHVHNLQKLVQKVNPNLLLVSLDLRGNNLQHEHAGQLGILMQRNRHLQRLDVGNNSLGKQGVKVLTAVLEYNTSLRHLNLSSNGICRESGGFIAQVLKKSNTVLHTLDLSNNPLDELGAKNLATGIAANSTLQRLVIANCNILDQGLGHLANAVKDNAASALAFLDVTNNKLTDIGVLKLYSVLETRAMQPGFKLETVVTLGNSITTTSFASVCRLAHDLGGSRPASPTSVPSRQTSPQTVAKNGDVEGFARSASSRVRRASHDSLASSDVDLEGEDYQSALQLSSDSDGGDEDVLLAASTVESPASARPEQASPPLPHTEVEETADEAYARAVEENRRRVVEGTPALLHNESGSFGEDGNDVLLSEDELNDTIVAHNGDAADDDGGNSKGGRADASDTRGELSRKSSEARGGGSEDDDDDTRSPQAGEAQEDTNEVEASDAESSSAATSPTAAVNSDAAARVRERLLARRANSGKEKRLKRRKSKTIQKAISFDV